MKKIIVDRIEGHFIVCEDEKENILELKKDDVIGDVKEGDVLVKGKEGKFCLDKALTEKRKKLQKKNIEQNTARLNVERADQQRRESE